MGIDNLSIVVGPTIFKCSDSEGEITDSFALQNAKTVDMLKMLLVFIDDVFVSFSPLSTPLTHPLTGEPYPLIQRSESPESISDEIPANSSSQDNVNEAISNLVKESVSSFLNGNASPKTPLTEVAPIKEDSKHKYAKYNLLASPALIKELKVFSILFSGN